LVADLIILTIWGKLPPTGFNAYIGYVAAVGFLALFAALPALTARKKGLLSFVILTTIVLYIAGYLEYTKTLSNGFVIAALFVIFYALFFLSPVIVKRVRGAR